eukprot:scaffold34516_cov106-Isochrysis_galbana.AAC.1
MQHMRQYVTCAIICPQAVRACVLVLALLHPNNTGSAAPCAHAPTSAPGVPAAECYATHPPATTSHGALSTALLALRTTLGTASRARRGPPDPMQPPTPQWGGARERAAAQSGRAQRLSRPPGAASSPRRYYYRHPAARGPAAPATRPPAAGERAQPAPSGRRTHARMCGPRPSVVGPAPHCAQWAVRRAHRQLRPGPTAGRPTAAAPAGCGG